MLTNVIHTKWVARVFVLLYLLLITSTGNASFWCKDAEASAHLESNLSGSCWMPCISESEDYLPNEQISETELILSSNLGDCVDSPVLSSAITRSKQSTLKNKSTTTNLNTPNPVFIQADYLRAERRGYRQRTHQLPPRQTLSALRTIVLLH